MESLEDNSRTQRDTKELLSCRTGIESDKITERRKHNGRLRELLELQHVVEYLTSCSGEGSPRGRPKSTGGGAGGGGLSWAGLWRSITVYVRKETEAICKLEEKGSGSTSALSNRQTKKKDVAETVRAFCKAGNKSGHHLPANEILEHILSVLGNSQLGAWLGKDYSQILLQHIISLPHYVINMSAQMWEKLTSLYCHLFLSPPSASMDRALLSKVINTLITQWLSQADLPIPKLYTFFTKTFANMDNQHSKVWEHLLDGLVSFSTVAVNARGRLCSLGEDMFLSCLHQWTRCTPAVKDLLIEFFRIQLTVHHPRGSHTDEEGAWASSDAVWKGHLEKLYDQLVADLDTMTGRLSLVGKSDSCIKFELLDLMADVFNQLFWIRSQLTFDPAQPRAKRRKSTLGWALVRDNLQSSMDSPSAVIWLQLVAWFVAKWPQCLHPLDHASLLSILAEMLRQNKRVACVRLVLLCLHALALHPSAIAASTSLSSTSNSEVTCSITTSFSGSSGLPSGASEQLWKKIWSSTIKILSVKTAEEEGYNLLAVLLERGLVRADQDPWKLLLTALLQPASCMVRLLASLLASQPLPENIHYGISVNLSLSELTQTQSSSSSNPAPSSLYPLRSQLLSLLVPTSSASLPESQETWRLAQLSNMLTSTPVSLLASILVGLTQRSCGSAQLPSLKPLYLYSNPREYAQLVLGAASVFPTSFTSVARQRERWERCGQDTWAQVEQVYLQSTFDLPLNNPLVQRAHAPETTLSRETTISHLLSLLLNLLSERAKLLLQQTKFEPSVTLRERAQHFSSLVLSLAQHCSLTVHCVFLLCHCEAFPSVNELRRTLAVRELPALLKRFVSTLRDPLWNEVDSASYYQAATSGVEMLGHLFHFPHIEAGSAAVSSSVAKALRVVRKLCCLSMPQELIETVSSLAQAKRPVISPVASSTFSLCGSSSESTSRGPSLPRDSQTSSFEDDMEVAESHPSLQSEPSSSSLTTPADILSSAGLNRKSLCQLEASLFLCHLYLCFSSGFHGDSDVLGMEDEGGMAAEVRKVIVALLEDLSCPLHIQLVFSTLQTFADSAHAIDSSMLKVAVTSLGRLLRLHRNDQAVYRRGLNVLTQLVPQLSKLPPGAGGDLDPVKQSSRSLLSAFWTLYKEQKLCSSVRIELACLIKAMFEADRSGQWAWIDATRKRRSPKEGGAREKMSLKDAMISLLHDADHGVRMHMATAITTLFFCDGSKESHDSHVTLLPRQEQEKVYDQINAMLQRANQVKASQDQLSVEDDSVNRVASMIATLLHEACVSPVCEMNVASLLINAVGQIDHDLVAKALSLLASYLGYTSRRKFLEDMLVSIVRKWVEQDRPLLEFPVRLLECTTTKDFFRTYHHEIFPLLVARCDETTLNTLASNVLATPLSDLLKESLPACMVLILTTYSEQSTDRGGEMEEPLSVGEEDKKIASESHNLLTRILSEEVISQTVLNSIDGFVVQLLTRMFESLSDHSQLAQFCVTSDPAPCQPHYNSHAVRATLDYLPSCYGNSALGNSFIRLLSRKKDNIQKILLSLAVKIDSTHRYFLKRRLLLSYNLFVKLVCREFQDGLDKTQSFVVMDIVHTISRVLSATIPGGATPTSGIRQLFPLCCDILETLCKAALSSCPHELEQHLQTIVASLVPFAKEDSAFGRQALSLLTYLLQTADPDCLSQLDPFPEAIPLQPELRQLVGGANNLSSEIDRFLSVDVQCSRREGLRAMASLLHQSKFELSSLIEQGCHSDAGALRLVQGLLDLCQKQPACFKEMGCEVARCLGEVGPVDFKCIALSSTSSHNTFDSSYLPTNWTPSQIYTAKLLHQLTAMLMDKNMSVVQASGECLRAVLATKPGAYVLSKVEETATEGTEWFSLLEPFKPQKRKKSVPSALFATPTTPPTTTHIDSRDLWLPSVGVSHQQWITRLVTTLIDSGAVQEEVLVLTRNVCTKKLEFCEEVFPLIIYDLLCQESGGWREVISWQLRQFFENVESVSRPSTPSIPNHTPSTTPITPDSIRTIVSTIMYLRTVNRPKSSQGTSTSWDNNFWLDLDFLAIAKAAHVCSAHFTSLLFTEIWYDVKVHRSTTNDDVMEVDQSQLVQELGSSNVQGMLQLAYSQIGEPDSLYGVCSAHATDEMTRIHLYEHEKEWSKSLSACDLQMLLPGAISESTLAESLRQLGLYHVLSMYLCGVKAVKGEGVTDVSEYQFEAAWRCAQWEEGAVMTTPSLRVGGYHQTLHSSLTALRDGEVDLLQVSIADARNEVMRSFCCTSLESTCSLYPLLSQLLCLLEVEEASSLLASSADRIPAFVREWKERLPLLNSDFQFIEPVLATRCSLLYCLLQNAAAEVKGQSCPPVEVCRKVDHLFDALNESLLTRVEFARQAGCYQVCEGALFSLKRHLSQIGSYGVSKSLCSTLPWTLKLEEAKLNWERKDTTLAIALLKTLLTKLNMLTEPAPSVKSLYPSALCLYGSWLAETHSENPSVIMEKYLEKSVQLMEDLHGDGDHTAVVGAYVTLGRYADSQYQRIDRQMRSSTFEAKKQLLLKTKKDLQRFKDELTPDARNRNRHYRTLVAQSEEDEIAVQSMLKDKHLFLCKALQNYMLCLRTGDKYDLRVFRLCALWFANSANPEVNELIEKGSGQLESRKFLPLMYQLAARMSARQPSSQFQKILQKIIYRTTLNHPYHCLYVILALSNASKDNVYPISGHVTGTRLTGRSGRLSKKPNFTSSVDEDKVKAAGDMIKKLRSEKATLVQSVERLCEAYIDLAYHDVSAFKKERGPVKLPSSCLLLKLSRLEIVAVPTVDLAVDPSCCYDNIVSIEGFDSFFQLAGGVNLPKVMSCLCSDGKRRRQLVKGRDDLRQDAVMQQVFVLVNRLLKKEPSTMKRQLCVRTYRVIPFSQRSGIVEWCEGTLPLGEYLIGSIQNPYPGAHCRYRPTDWLSINCRKKLTQAREDKVRAYSEICHNFKPVFHHFFMEKFTSPPQWFERRLTYTRSVAASSIVGYIVGLGDRHVQNILIDTNSAELIHIDLGVAFEQGKTLPTPETVPFRLTRDLVDGMGLTGVEGVFRQCCEKTMILMRTYHEELKTILEVLLYDPLYQWTLSPLKAMTLQRHQEPAEESAIFFDGDNGTSTTMAAANGQADSTNKMAERVLLRLQEKLEGIEDGVPLSISGQVNHLIQEATDPANLCLLFPGWQPWI